MEGVKQSTSIYYMFEEYYTKALWGSKGFRADPPNIPILAKKAIFGGMPCTPLKTSKLPYPLKGLWYSTAQTFEVVGWTLNMQKVGIFSLGEVYIGIGMELGCLKISYNTFDNTTHPRGKY